MDNKDKLNRLLTYQQHLNNQLTSPIPAKHTHRPEQYKAFLKNELKLVSNKLEALKLS